MAQTRHVRRTVASPNLFYVKRDPYVILLRFVNSVTTGLFGRGYGFAMRRVRQLLPNRTMTITLSDNSRFSFEVGDFYWNRVVLPDYKYEPELEYALHLFKGLDYVLLDCGANIGYWSVLATSKIFGANRAIAVEACPQTFELLQMNMKANNNRFKSINNALFNETGHSFTMTEAKHHSARQIRDIKLQKSAPTVSSITVDDILRTHKLENVERLIIKLDVEGQEINSLKGAERAFEREVLVIYEDHAKDVSHEPTHYMLDVLKLSVFYIDEQSSVRRICAASDLDAIKSKKHVGYNFFACRDGTVFYKMLSELVC